MKKIFLLAVTALLISCGSSRVITSKEEQLKYGETSKSPSEKVESSTPNTSSQSTEISNQPEVVEVKSGSTNKVENYITMYSAIAQYEMKKTGIPASITLAQGILESGAGQGDLTQRANNHFGIKCHGWSGEKVYHDDDKKQECFRKYKHPRESFHDHSEFLTSRSRYAFLFNYKQTDYKSWAKGLRKAGYATDPKYPNKLISLIERYNLSRFDSGEIVTKPVEVLADQASENYHKVKKGDTLYSIARKYGTSVEKIIKLNNLEGTNLQLDQELKIK